MACLHRRRQRAHGQRRDRNSITDATAGSIGFDSNYQTNDVYFAAVSGTANNQTAFPLNSGGVFLFGGSTWEELTAGEK